MRLKLNERASGWVRSSSAPRGFADLLLLEAGQSSGKGLLQAEVRGRVNAKELGARYGVAAYEGTDALLYSQSSCKYIPLSSTIVLTSAFNLIAPGFQGKAKLFPFQRICG